MPCQLIFTAPRRCREPASLSFLALALLAGALAGCGKSELQQKRADADAEAAAKADAMEEARQFVRRFNTDGIPAADHTLGDALDELPLDPYVIAALYGIDIYDSFRVGTPNEDLKFGAPFPLKDLTAQRLRFRLPETANRCWSKDGKVLYAVSEILTEAGEGGHSWRELLRIDTTTWTVTHRLECPRKVQRMGIEKVTLTSEGLLIGILHELAVEIPIDSVSTRLEYHDINYLHLLDPDTLELKKLYRGPIEIMSGSPDSPIVCLSGAKTFGALVDIRDGKVLDRIAGDWKEKLPEFKGIGDLVMSPRGNVVYSAESAGRVALFDVSGGKFSHTGFLPHGGGQEGLFLSHDGKRLAVGPDSADDNFAIIPTEPAGGPLGIDEQSPPALRSVNSTELAFFGSENYVALNRKKSGVMEMTIGQNIEFVGRERYEFKHPDAYENGEGNLRLCGAPSSNHVLMGMPTPDPGKSRGIEEMTLWVHVPDELVRPAPSPFANKLPPTVRGEEPADPLLLLDEPIDKHDRRSGLPRVAIKDGRQIACSPDGSLVYVLGGDGMLRAFDTSRFREVRCASVAKPDTASHDYVMHVTKAGLLVGAGDPPSVELLDLETLEGRHGFAVNAFELVSSPNLSSVATRGARGDCEFYDVETGQLVYRLNGRTAAMLPTTSGFKGRFRETFLSPCGKGALVGWGDSWVYFDITPDGLKYRAALYRDSENYVFPVPSVDKVVRTATSDTPTVVDDLNNLDQPGVQIDDRGKFIAPNGWIFGGSTVYDATGEILYEHRLVGGEVVALPQRPTRVFSLNLDLSVVDLDKPADAYTGLRVWTSGKHTAVAKLVEVKEGKAVLESIEGKRSSLPLELLSDEDREFIEAQQTPKGKKRR